MGKRMKFFMGLFLSLALLQAVFVPFGAGLISVGADDFPSRYILISTKQQLSDIRNNLNGDYMLTNDIVFTESDFQPGGAFYNDGKGWEPIGSFEKPFTGSFDGNDFAIEGGKITTPQASMTPATGDEYIGLFAVNAGSIDNITLWDWDISITCNNNSFVGGICGVNQNGIKDSTVKASIAVKYEGTSTTLISVGAVAGRNEHFIGRCLSFSTVECSTKAGFLYGGGIAGSNESLIEGCANRGEVYVKNPSTNSKFGVSAAGGIAGSSNGFIKRSDNFTEVRSEGDKVTTYAGGIAGVSAGEFRSCRNDGEVHAETREENVYSTAGGIAGELYLAGFASECYNKGNITSRGKGTVYAGGIAGQIMSNGLDYHQALSFCANMGDIEAVSSEEGEVFAGGICGRLEGLDKDFWSIEILYNSGNVSGKATSDSPSHILDCYVGGIIGHYITNASIKYSENYGEIKGETVGSKADGSVNAGGILGKDEGGSVLSCANWGDVESKSNSNSMSGGIIGVLEGSSELNPYMAMCFNAGDISSYCTNEFAVSGGIVGYNELSAIFDSYNSGKVKAVGQSISSAASGGIIGYAFDSYLDCCYNIGIVEGSSSATGSYAINAIGGICGYNEDSGIFNGYYINKIKEGVGKTSEHGENEVYQKTDAEMKKQSTYKDFDFQDMWFIDSKADYKYPQIDEFPHEATTIGIVINRESDYRIDGDFLVGVRDNTTLEEFLTNFEDLYNVIVVDKKGYEVYNDSEIITTYYSLLYVLFDSAFEWYDIVVYGDISGDGKINASDYLMAKRAFMGSIELDPPQMKAACLSGGDTVKAGDYLKIKRHFLGTYDLFDDMLYK